MNAYQSRLWRSLLLFALLPVSTLQAQRQNVIERGAHHRVWQRDDFVALPNGRVVNRPPNQGYDRFTNALSGTNAIITITKQ